MASPERIDLTEGHSAFLTAVSMIEALDTSIFAIQPGHHAGFRIRWCLTRRRA
jgi:hypothetical protein